MHEHRWARVVALPSTKSLYKDLSVPERCGQHAVILIRGGQGRLACSAA